MNDIVKDKEKFKIGWTGGLPETPCGFGSKLSQYLLMTHRQRYKEDRPEILYKMPYLEELILNKEKQDTMRLIEL